MIKNLVKASEFNAGFLRKRMADLADEQMCVQPAGLPNHPAWQVGHLCFVRSNICKLLGSQVIPIPESWNTLFGRNSVPAGNRAAYPSKAELMTTYDRLQTALLASVSELTHEKLSAPHPVESFKETLPTLGDLITWVLLSHDGLHLGQLTDWRRATGAGKPA